MKLRYLLQPSEFSPISCNYLTSLLTITVVFTSIQKTSVVYLSPDYVWVGSPYTKPRLWKSYLSSTVPTVEPLFVRSAPVSYFLTKPSKVSLCKKAPIPPSSLPSPRRRTSHINLVITSLIGFHSEIVLRYHPFSNILSLPSPSGPSPHKTLLFIVLKQSTTIT